MPPYGWATYKTGTRILGRCPGTRDRAPENPTSGPTTIVKSEIGRRNANDSALMIWFRKLHDRMPTIIDAKGSCTMV